MRLRTDTVFREALYGLYLALFRASKNCPTDFHPGRLTTIQTAIMGIEDHGWRVIGITPEALQLLASVGFRKDKLPRQLCRGHVVDRIRTTKLLFEREEPVHLSEFFERFLENDTTVIMLTDQNKKGQEFPIFIPIENAGGELFSNGSLMGWKHRKKEREFLMKLHSGQSGNAPQDSL